MSLERKTQEYVLTDAKIAAVLSEATIDGAKANIAINTHGTFTGDGNANRAIAHGLGVIPSVVFVSRTSGTIDRSSMILDDIHLIAYGNAFITHQSVAMDVTNFYLDTNYYMNSSAIEFKWTAIP